MPAPVAPRACCHARRRPPRPGARTPGRAVRGVRRAAARADQRYCLACGERRGPRRLDPVAHARAREGRAGCGRRASGAAAGGAAPPRRTPSPRAGRRRGRCPPGAWPASATLLMLGFGIAAGAAAGPHADATLASATRRADDRRGPAARGRARRAAAPAARRRSPGPPPADGYRRPPARRPTPPRGHLDARELRARRLRDDSGADDASRPTARRRDDSGSDSGNTPDSATTRRPRPRRRRSSTSGSSR